MVKRVFMHKKKSATVLNRLEHRALFYSVQFDLRTSENWQLLTTMLANSLKGDVITNHCRTINGSNASSQSHKLIMMKLLFRTSRLFTLSSHYVYVLTVYRRSDEGCQRNNRPREILQRRTSFTRRGGIYFIHIEYPLFTIFCSVGVVPEAHQLHQMI